MTKSRVIGIDLGTTNSCAAIVEGADRKVKLIPYRGGEYTIPSIYAIDEKGNELIDAINALQNINIRYGEYFKASYGHNGVTLTIPYAEPAQFDDYELIKMKVCIDGEIVERDFFVALSG